MAFVSAPTPKGPVPVAANLRTLSTALRRLAWLALAALPAACSFDDTGLADKLDCRRDSDCVRGSCVAGVCAAAVAPDATQPPPENPGCPGTENACGGCDRLPDIPGVACDASCGRYVCAADGESLRCESTVPNACGGCLALALPPGTACGECGEAVCQSGNTVCVETGGNACGGCTVLAGEPGRPCGSCNGVWTCDGPARVRCDETRDMCGGCGPPDASLGTNCGCAVDGFFEARFRCDGDTLRCRDSGDSRTAAQLLGSVDTTSQRVVTGNGIFAYDGDSDWFTVQVRDTDALGTAGDGMFPRVILRDALPNAVACVGFTRDDGRPLASPSCSAGAIAYVEGLPMCCATAGPGGQAVATLRLTETPSNPSGRLDTPGSDDAGTVEVQVRLPAPPTSCQRYQVDLSL